MTSLAFGLTAVLLHAPQPTATTLMFKDPMMMMMMMQNYMNQQNQMAAIRDLQRKYITVQDRRRRPLYRRYRPIYRPNYRPIYYPYPASGQYYPSDGHYGSHGYGP